MASTNFVDFSTPIVAAWLNAINSFFYSLFAGATTPAQALAAIGGVSSSNPTFTGIVTMPTNGVIQYNNALSFQTNTPNLVTAITFLPNGTSQDSQLLMRNSSDPNNFGILGLHSSGTSSRLFSSKSGTAPYVPLVLNAGGVDRIVMAVNGEVGINKTPDPNIRLDVNGCIAIGTGGGTGPGTIFSDTNFGMRFQARQASPAVNEFCFADSVGTTSIATTPGLGGGCDINKAVVGIGNGAGCLLTFNTQTPPISYNARIYGQGPTGVVGGGALVYEATAGHSFIGAILGGDYVAAFGGVGGRRGTAVGALQGQPNNFYWAGAALEYWVGPVNVGNVTIASDYRTKKDVTDLESTWDAVKALRPVKYTQAEYTPEGAEEPLFIEDDKERWSFVAHELQDTLIQSAATGYKDAPDLIQSPDLMTIVAALTKSLQEAMARIEALEAL